MSKPEFMSDSQVQALCRQKPFAVSALSLGLLAASLTLRSDASGPITLTEFHNYQKLDCLLRELLRHNSRKRCAVFIEMQTTMRQELLVRATQTRLQEANTQ